MDDLESITRRLEESPGDWEIRVLAVEAAVRAGDMDEARRFVREDPSGMPAPPEIQVRIHGLLTQGKAALAEEATPEPVGEPEEVVPEERRQDSPGPDAARDPVAEALAGVRKEEEKEPGHEGTASEESSAEAARKRFQVDPDLDGGLGALVERDDVVSTTATLRSNRPAAPTIRWETAISRWRDYDGDLCLVEADYALPPERVPTTSDRFSSLAFAIFAHIIAFLLIALVVVQVPLPKPPQLVVSVVPDRQTELVTPRITKPDIEVKPAAAASQAIDVISSIGESSFNLPEVDDAESFVVQSLVAGLQPVGNGMSFSTEATKASDVNFFGISGGGRKIVFIIDATPKMLVDEKGGMTAYDKVKDEVGVMLANLNRGTHFNILLYQGKRVVSFREKLVPGLPSNLRLAIEWMSPLNRDYSNLGLGGGYGNSLAVADHEDLPIQSADVGHYTKAIQKAMEWEASAVFCIASGYERMTRSPTAEMRKMMEENPPQGGTPGSFDPAEQKAWRDAVAKTRAWLEKENAARREKGISPKVVVNFNQLVRERTGATPPRRRGGTPATGGANLPNLPPVTPEDIEKQVEELVDLEYKEEGLEEPSVHMVLFLGEDERIGDAEDHFRRLTRRNRGKLKILRGLAALQDITTSK